MLIGEPFRARKISMIWLLSYTVPRRIILSMDLLLYSIPSSVILDMRTYCYTWTYCYTRYLTYMDIVLYSVPIFILIFKMDILLYSIPRPTLLSMIVLSSKTLFWALSYCYARFQDISFEHGHIAVLDSKTYHLNIDTLSYSIPIGIILYMDLLHSIPREFFFSLTLCYTRFNTYHFEHSHGVILDSKT